MTTGDSSNGHQARSRLMVRPRFVLFHHRTRSGAAPAFLCATGSNGFGSLPSSSSIVMPIDDGFLAPFPLRVFVLRPVVMGLSFRWVGSALPVLQESREAPSVPDGPGA